MNFAIKAASAAILCAVVSMSTAALAQAPPKPRPAKAPPTSPLHKAAVIATFTGSAPVAVAPTKPVVVTAVVPHGPVPSSGHSIIFVGGKAQSGGNAALNPQPIPPGHGGPVDPVR